MAIDLVCGMEVPEDKAAAISEYGGKTYYFCAEYCKREFDREPQKYLSPAWKPPGMPGSSDMVPEGRPVSAEDKNPPLKPDHPSGGRAQRVDLPVRGMSCAGCAGKIEKALLKVRGVVKAAVNLATGRARVEFLPSETSVAELRRTIESTGYKVLEVPADVAGAGIDRAARLKEYNTLRLRFFSGIFLAIVILIGSMHHWFPWAPRLLGNFYFLWLLTTPVQFLIGWPFLRGARESFWSRTAHMNTLVAVGTLSAYLYSAPAPMFPAFFRTGG